MAWTPEELSADAAAAFYKAALQRRENVEKDARAVRRQSLIWAIGGAVVGILGMAAGLTAYIKTPVPEPPGYIVMDRSTGWISQPLTALNAPKEFSESIRQRAIRNFIIACASYIPQTWARLDWHACMIQATPDLQKRLAAEMGSRESPKYPPAIFGQNGWAMPTSFPSMTLLGETGPTPNQVFRYEVRYQRTEVIGGREIRVLYTAQMTLTFRPDLRMTAEDRQINPSGLQTISFSAVAD